MILKYLEAIQNLYEKFKNTNGDFTFNNFITTIGLSLGMALMVAGILFFIGLLCFAPFKSYKLFVKTLKTERSNVLIDETLKPKDMKDKIDTLNKKIRNKTILYVMGIIFIYLPIAIPTLLYICYIMFHI